MAGTRTPALLDGSLTKSPVMISLLNFFIRFSKQDANIGIFSGCCDPIYFHCTLRTFLKLPSCVTGYSRSYVQSDLAMTRDRYISEGYLYFLSYYSRAYQKLFSDDPAQITSLKNVRGSITLKTYRQGYLRSTIGERSPILGVPVVTYHVILQA